MKVFKGWYGRADKDGQIHRIKNNRSLSSDHIATTICGIRIPAEDLRYFEPGTNVRTDIICSECDNSSFDSITETVHSLLAQKLENRKGLIAEIRQLIRPREFIIHLFGDDGISVEVKWEDSKTLSLDPTLFHLSQHHKKKCVSLEYAQKRIKSLNKRIQEVCRMSDNAANALGEDPIIFFENLLEEAEQQS